MYVAREMKPKPAKKDPNAIRLAEEHNAYDAGGGESMVRTQIYLTRDEHAFLLREASRQDTPMAAVIRGYIDEKMGGNGWDKNPLLEPPAGDFSGPEDAALNHDHYVYGAPKLYKKVKGKWVYAP